MVMQFGQFLDHDITLTEESNVTGCCTDDALNGVFATGCFPILIPNADPTFANLVFITVILMYAQKHPDKQKLSLAVG